MRTIKTRTRVQGIKVLDKSVSLSRRMKTAAIRLKERAEETQEPRQNSPIEYAADKIQSAAHNAVRTVTRQPPNPLKKARENWRRAKSHFREVKQNLPGERRQAAEQAKNAAGKAREHFDKLKTVADKTQKTADEAKSAVTDAKRTLKEVKQDSRRTLREIRQNARAEPPKLRENHAKRFTVKNRANGNISSNSPNKPTIANPARSTITHGKAPQPPDSRPNYVRSSVKSAARTAQAPGRVGKAAQSTVKTTKQVGKGAVKTAKKSVKTAEKTAKATVKTAKQTAKAAKTTAKTAVKAAQAAERTARAAAKAAVQTAKATAKAVTALMKVAIAAIKTLVTAIAAGGWVAVLIVLIVCLIGLILGSVFGIFFSGEDSGSGQTINSVVAEIDAEYTARLDAIIAENPHDIVDMSGARAAWKQVLAVYTVKTVTDPDKPMEVATIDDAKAEILRSVFWEMNEITCVVETVDVEVDVLGDDGEPSGETEIITQTVLRIIVTHKTADEMAVNFTKKQREWLEELLSPEYNSLWNALLYGISGVGDGSLIGVAETQLGNVGGETYWRWYGFSNRESWCACFVSWCAEQCGFIESGVLPRFSLCDDGINWFKERDLWRESDYTPAPGDLIFFDWNSNGESDHVGIVERIDGDTVFTIEGNSSDSVARRSYSLGSVSIIGYGTPEYNN